jgi:hypothetical protein
MKHRGNLPKANKVLLSSMLWLALASLVTASSHAQLGARPLAMGAAFSGLADDANAVFWNPAGLAQLKNRSFTGTYNTDWKKFDHDLSFALAFPTKQRGTFAAGYTINWDKAGRTGAGVEVCDQRDDSFLFLTYGRYLFANTISAGFAVKRDYKEFRSEEREFARWERGRFDLDLGFLATFGKRVGEGNRLSFGFLWQDMFKCKWNDLRNFRPGMAFRPDDATVITVEVSDLFGDSKGLGCDDVSQDISLGVERWFVGRMLALRIGESHLNNSERRAFAYGIGLRLKPQLDLAGMSFENCKHRGDIQFIGLTFSF